MVPRPRNGLSLCAGGGGLDMGLMLAEPGFHTRCYVEWEDYPRSVLIAAQSAGYFAPAPIWDDVTSFDGKPFRGAIDTLLAGYPCQPFSQAGQRKGEKDARHLWPDIARIIGEIRPTWLFLENVAGHFTLGLEAVLRDLYDMGFTPAAGAFSAAESGAPHERLRVKIVAYSDGNAQFANRRKSIAWSNRRDNIGGGSRVELANAGIGRSCGPGEGKIQQPRGTEVVGSGKAVDHTAGIECKSGGMSVRGKSKHAGPQSPIGNLAQSAKPGFSDRIAKQQSENATKGRSGLVPKSERHSGNLADTSGPGPQGRKQPGSSDQRHRPEAHGPTAEHGRPWLHPPAPNDAAGWAHVLQFAPDLAPSVSRQSIAHAAKTFAARLVTANPPQQHNGPHRTAAETVAGSPEMVVGFAQAQSDLCGMVDAMAKRARSFKLLGNGVCPLAAAHAWRALANAHGLRPVYLETNRED